MIMSTFEYMNLFGNKDKNEVTEEDVIKARKKYRERINNNRESSSSFRTYNTVGIIIDEYGSETIGIINKTGFEMDN